MVAERPQVCRPEEVAEAKAELLRTFGSMGGVTARAEGFGRALPQFRGEAVVEALAALVEEGSVEAASLADGATVYQFIRH